MSLSIEARKNHSSRDTHRQAECCSTGRVTMGLPVNSVDLVSVKGVLFVGSKHRVKEAAVASRRYAPPERKLSLGGWFCSSTASSSAAK